MPSRSRFAPKTSPAPKGRKLSANINKDLQGYNSSDPYTVLKDSVSPYLRNARMYEADDSRQVAISTRTGADAFTVPVGEAIDLNYDAASDGTTLTVDNVNVVAIRFARTSAKSLSKIAIKVGGTSISAPLLVRIYSDSSGSIGTLLATSSVKPSDVPETPAFRDVKFVEAPAYSTTYSWAVFQAQEKDDVFNLPTTTTFTDSTIFTSLDAGETYVSFPTSVPGFKTYNADTGGVKGSIRFSPSTGSKVHFFGHLNNVYSVDDGTGAVTSRLASLNSNAKKVRFAQFDDAVFMVNGYNNLHRSTGAAFSDISGTSTTTVANNIIAHNNRIFIVKASEPTRMEWCELATYTTWDSTAFAYVPEPKSSDPITALFSFQNDLIVFTRNRKFRLVGDYLENFQLEEAYGSMGTISQETVCADENYIYFVGTDGHVYRWNGNKDEQISRAIEADLDNIADLENVALTHWRNRLYYWFQTSGGTSYNANFVYETRFREWFYDTGRHINGAVMMPQEGDNIKYASSTLGALYSNSEQWSDVGRPINFEYHTNYFDFGAPDNYKQVRRMYLHFRIPTWRGTTLIGTDLDYKNTPEYREVEITPGGDGAVVGSFVLGDGSTLGQSEQYYRHRINSPGLGTVFQARVKKVGVDTPVYLIAHSQYYRNRRPA
jgi:hypothetical protein